MEMLTPEQKARKMIDLMLLPAGWDICDRSNYTPLSSAVAIEEGLLKGNLEADYLLFIDGRAIGVLEAKRRETPLNDKVYQQAYKYTHKVPSWVSAFITPLPLIYLSNGDTLLFKDTRTETEHFRSYPIEELMQRDKTFLDITWLKQLMTEIKE